MEDDAEPTPGAGPCIDEALEIDEDEFRLLWEFIDLTEHDRVDILVYDSDGVEAYIEAFAGVECLQILALKIRGCGDVALEYLKAAADWPEVSRVVIEGGCVELTVPPEPPLRVARALDRLGVEKPIVPMAFRIKGIER